MRPLVLILCSLLLAACNAAPAPTSSPSPPVSSTPATTPRASSPGSSPGTFVWEEYHSDDLVFSLQLPRGWTAQRAGPSEGVVLRAEGGEAGSLVLTIETAGLDGPFQQIVNEYFKSILEENPDAVQGVDLAGGRAARAVSPRDDGGVSVIYLFAPEAGHAKTLSFTWDRPEPNPLWRDIAERFNAYGTRPIIQFITPAPSG